MPAERIYHRPAIRPAGKIGSKISLNNAVVEMKEKVTQRKPDHLGADAVRPPVPQTTCSWRPGADEIRVVAFCCNWCSYAGADLAGVMRLQMPVQFTVVRVMCSARVSPELVLKAFQKGADGVMVLGCHIGDCHYLNGNHRTLKRFAVLKELLKCTGIAPHRLLVGWVSASEGARFQQLVTDFITALKKHQCGG
jgi:coenzyme F420-reducing hydrogenase delta subunit